MSELTGMSAFRRIIRAGRNRVLLFIDNKSKLFINSVTALQGETVSIDTSLLLETSWKEV